MTDYIEITLNNKLLRFYSEEKIEAEYQNVKDDWRPMNIYLDNKGYRRFKVCFNGKTKQFRLHRVVYFAYNPKWDINDRSQNNTIDHHDRNKNNNHISNLKIATAIQQACNKNCEGVTWNKKAQKWYARITINGKREFLGSFDKDKKQDALDVYQKAKLARDNIVWTKNDNAVSNLIDNIILERCKGKQPGVNWDKKREKWYVQFYINGKQKHLGYFDDYDEAVAVRKKAEANFPKK